MTSPDDVLEPSRHPVRSTIVDAAAHLLREGGTAAVTTRAVATRASVQAPTIYRLFGDKDGLLDAVAEHVFAAYVVDKARTSGAATDPVADLDHGWRTHIDFGLANPALFALVSDPTRSGSPAVVAGLDILHERVHRVALAGRLAVAETRAVGMLHAAGTGVLQTLLGVPPDERDPGLAQAVYDAVKRSIITDAPAAGIRNRVAAAVELRAGLAGVDALTAVERALLGEWLDRVVAQSP